MSTTWRTMAERGATAAINVMSLSKAEYEPLEMPPKCDGNDTARQESSDVAEFGGLLTKSGMAIAAVGYAAELLPESTEALSRSGVAAGLGAAVIGAVILGYEKLSS